MAFYNTIKDLVAKNKVTYMQAIEEAFQHTFGPNFQELVSHSIYCLVNYIDRNTSYEDSKE